MKRAGFVKNAVVLTVTALLLRSLGMIFRVYLSGKLGEEGMGLYQLILSVYALLSTFATSGICTAVTRLCAQELAHRREKAAVHILCVAVLLSVGVGLISAAVSFFGAPIIARFWLRDMRAVSALQALSVSLPFMGVSSCLRGYFTAKRQVAIPARTQIIEQAVRLGTVFLLLPYLLPYGTATACAGVFVGDSLAEAVCCLLLWWHTSNATKDAQGDLSQTGTVRRIGQIALPITGGRYLHTALRTGENLLAPTCLAYYGGGRQAALAAFGSLKGMALPLLFFPSSFLNAVSTLLLPEVSAADALGDKAKVRRTAERTLYITLLSSLLLAAAFYSCADALGLALYQSRQVGFYLRVLAPLVPVMYLESMVDGMLKGLGQQVATLRYSVIDSAVRIVLIVAMVPFLGMKGFLLIMLVSNLLTSILNVQRLVRVTGASLRVGRWIVLPSLSAVLAVVATQPVLRLCAAFPWWQAVCGATVTAGVYLLLIWCFGCVDKTLFYRAKGIDKRDAVSYNEVKGSDGYADSVTG